MTTTLEGQLEVDVARGVIYFHNAVNGCTTLRICGLKLMLPSDFGANVQVDITIQNTLVGVTRLPELASDKLSALAPSPGPKNLPRK